MKPKLKMKTHTKVSFTLLLTVLRPLLIAFSARKGWVWVGCRVKVKISSPGLSSKLNRKNVNYSDPVFFSHYGAVSSQNRGKFP